MLPDEDELKSPLTQQAMWLKDYKPGLRLEERGIVLSIGDGIARIFRASFGGDERYLNHGGWQSGNGV
ncbi:hypothetical protein ACBZ91_16855 [Vibrio natriegens]|uniref:hypothetical protein n=1 Tax=Vibrio natriegens TaxID=691 RepID=UPI0035577571